MKAKWLTYAVVAAIFAAGGMWARYEGRLAGVEAKAEEIPVIKERVESIEKTSSQQLWQQYKILEQVNPEAARVIPPPPNPYK